MSESPGSPVGQAVLLVNEDAFESGYVASVLGARGITVVGPYADVPSALHALEAAAPIGAAVTSGRFSDGMADILFRELAGRAVPHLTLISAKDIPVASHRLTLARPFAGYQVADWVVYVLARPTTMPPSSATLAATDCAPSLSC